MKEKMNNEFDEFGNNLSRYYYKCKIMFIFSLSFFMNEVVFFLREVK